MPDEYVLPDHIEDRTQRVFVLLDEGIQLQVPLGFEGRWLEGWWYIDVVDVSETSHEIKVTDWFIDVLVPLDLHPYRVLDLDELGEAISGGQLTIADAVMALGRLQTFLDRYLHVPGEPISKWHSFPPPALETLLTIPSWRVGRTHESRGRTE